MQSSILGLLGHFTYLAMVALLGAAGLGVPVSQDLVLLCGGVLAARGVTSLLPTILAGLAGVLLGDSLMWRWGRRLGPAAAEQRWIKLLLTPARVEKLRLHFARHGVLTVMAARHTPLVRAAVFFLSGSSGVVYWKFLLADLASALVTVPLWVWLGTLAGDHLPELRARIHHVEWYAAAAVATISLAVFWGRRDRARG